MFDVMEILGESAEASKLEGSWRIIAWITQIVAAGIMGQTLFFKYSAAPESVYIFSTLGVEPWGRLFTATLELVAVILLFTPRFAVFGSLLGIGLMFGALMSHLLILGIDVQGDGGLLFTLAAATLASCAVNVFVRSGQLLVIIDALRSRL